MADCIVLATGWRQDVSLLDAALRHLVLRDGGFQLYRQILPPEEPRLGFIGYASSSACPLTSELSAHWLSACFSGELRLPTIARMYRDIEQVSAWAHGVFPSRGSGFFIGPYVAHYADDLLTDLRIPRRRAHSVLSEYFAPLWPSRYRSLAAQRRTLSPQHRERA
jgi:hypothetical protein